LNHYQKLGGQAIIYGLGNIVPRILNYAVLTAYYTRRFSVEEYGVITELYAYVAILMVLLTYGMETGLFKFSVNSENRDVVFSSAFLCISFTSILFLLGVQLFRHQISDWIGYAGNPEFIVYLGATVSLDAVSALVFAKLRIENKVRRFALLKIINVLITIFLVFLFLEILPEIRFITASDWYVVHLKNIEVGYVFIANVVASFLVLLLLLWDLRAVRITASFRLLGNILAYSIPLLISGMAGIFNETIDRILLRRFLKEGLNPLHELGIYGANYRIAVLMTIFVQMFRYAAEPFFFNMYKSKDAIQIYANILKYFTIFLMIIFLGVALCIDFFKYFIDSSYYEGLGIVPVVLMANVMVGMLFNVNMWYKLTGHTLYGVYITGIGALITVLLNVILIPLYSYHACAWIHLLSNFVMFILTYFIGQKFFKIDYDIKRIIVYVGFALVLYFVGYFLQTDNDFFNVGIGVTFVFIYFIYCNRKENLMNVFFKKHES
jgi:O-antigen/teichoic acid export membrane protein